MTYNTKQREYILSYLKENKERHVTAADIITYFRTKGIKVGSATVYRYLDKLIKEGTVKKYILSEKDGACYQLNECGEHCSHYHFICNTCGNLYHIECDELDCVNKHIMSEHNFSIDLSKTVFCGKCADCGGGEG